MQSITAKKPSESFTTYLFLRFLAVVYFFAFLSAALQVDGLLGDQGLLPAARFLQSVSAQLSPPDSWLSTPTVAWLNSSSAGLLAVCWIGVAASILAFVGIGSGFAFAICYVMYLSIVSIGQALLSYQWDYLLLETGFLALFISPWLDRPGTPRSIPRPPKIMLWVLRIVLFKLMLMSGLAKLLSGDPTWANLTAMTYHYETQPLPTPIGWLAHQLPVWFQKFSTLAMFAIELGGPFLIFFGRRGRLIAAMFFVFLQVLIALTGNYTFFNLLAIALCILLLDDNFFQNRLASPVVARLLTQKLRIRCERFVTSFTASSEVDLKKSKPRIIATRVIAAILLYLNASVMLGLRVQVLDTIARMASAYGICNGYGLFAVMTTERIEIILEGSNDKQTWLAYELPFQASDLRRIPPMVAPMQPRLDWQMWFASLSTYENEPWFGHLVFRLLKGEPKTLALFSKNPFPSAPPRYIRASKYRYQFTSIPTLLKTGEWWNRTYVGEYFPIASIDGPR